MYSPFLETTIITDTFDFNNKRDKVKSNNSWNTFNSGNYIGTTFNTVYMSAADLLNNTLTN